MARILVTAGPTREHLDAVRYLANGSSGRMGYALAEAAHRLGHAVTLVSGPVAIEPPPVEVRNVVSAREMLAATEAVRDRVDVVLAAAAVADYRPAETAAGKPPKDAAGLTLQLVPNPDVLGELGRYKAALAGTRPFVLVGFALQDGTDREAALAAARRKLAGKNLDLVVLNHLEAMGAPDNEVFLLSPDGSEDRWPRLDKAALAEQLVDRALQLLPPRSRQEEV